MGVVFLFISSLMWSFVGVLVKLASSMADSQTITFCRFFFGFVFLGILLLIKDGKIKVHWRSRWIWIGALGKCGNYVFENIGLTIGYSYGNVLVIPIQTIFLIFVSVVFFKEKMNKKSWISSAVCLAGIFLISWNGVPLEKMLGSNIYLTLLFALAAIGAGCHVLSQKRLSGMDAGSMNFSVFMWSSLLMAIPLPLSSGLTGRFSIGAAAALVVLGLITGISFYVYSLAIKRVPFIFAIIISNSSVLFQLVWSRLFYNDPITPFIVFGSLLFITGIVILNLPSDMLLRHKGCKDSEESCGSMQ